MLEFSYESFYEDYFINKKIGREKFYNDVYPEIIRHNLDVKRIIIKDILNVWEKRRLGGKRINVLVWGSKFEFLLNDINDNFCFFLITNSVKEYWHFCQKGNYRVHFSHKWQALVDKGYTLYDLKYTKIAIKKVADFIKSNDIKLVILGNDKLFVEKLLQYAASEANVKTIVIQHGIYNVDSFRILNTSNTAEHFLTWSRYVKDIYRECFPNINNDIRVIGYPFEINRNQMPKKPVALFLGNQYANYNKIEGENYLKIAKLVYEICREKGIDFIYRKHPAEILNMNYGDIKECVSNNKELMDDLNRVSIVIGDVSSVMLESALVGKHVIQIIWSERSSVGLKDLMYSFTEKTDATYAGISKAIDNCINREKANAIDDYYLWINENIGADLNDIMMELIN